MFQESDDRRFMAKVRVNRSSGCWLWRAAMRGKYGCFSVKGKAIDAHRWAYLRWCGPIEKEQKVCHKCDTPACCNPDHLFLGTHTDNMRDASKKKRLAGAKLTDRKASYIRKSDLTDAELAKKYGVWPSTIRRIRKNQSWCAA
jgi:hypothetical protein